MGLVQNIRFLSAFGKFTKELEKNGMSKLIPSLVALAMAALDIFGDSLQALVAGHPKAAVIVGAIAMIASHLAPQPQGGKN